MSKCDVTRRVCKAWCSSLCAAACAGTARGSRAASFLAKGLAIAAALAATTTPATAVDEAAAAKGPPLTITLLVSSRPDACHDTGEVAAITGLATREAQRINTYGGIGGRPIAIAVLDDRRDEALTIANVGQALSAPNALAMVGVSASSRGKAVFEKLGSRIRAEGIPFISDLSVSSIFSDYPNVFTTRSSQDEERVPVIAAFIDRYRFSRPAFIGSADAVFSTALGDGLLRLVGADKIAADHRLAVQDGRIAEAAVATAVADIVAKRADLVVLGVGSRATPDIVKALKDASYTPALLVTGRIDNLPAELTSTYPNAIYQLAWDDLPEVYNNRLRQLIAIEPPEDWVFAGAVNSAAPGWSKGECKKAEVTDAEPDPLEPVNMRAIALGAQYADMIALIAATARGAPPEADLPTLRRRIRESIVKNFALGRGAFKGSFENWAFNPQTRTAARTPFVVILPQGLGRTQLAPVQFLRGRDGSLNPVSTFYADIDLIRAHRVDDNEKTFFAEFYLSLRANEDASLDRIEFANAYLDPRTSGRQISIETVHAGGPSATYPESMRIYKVTGRFLFDPRLADYPFDTQLFSIELQPKSGDRPFLIQPPPLDLRDKRVTTDGWEPIKQFVGTDQDFVPVVDAYTHQPSVVPFYTSSFSWMMRRETTDYFLRVVIPLAFILIVAYLSIFIPRSHFEAIVTIQVTALLSAVALYLSLPQRDSDTATLSDRLFVFDYMMVSLMIGISILRVNPHVASRAWVMRALDTIHVIGIPMLVAYAGWRIMHLSGA